MTHATTEPSGERVDCVAGNAEHYKGSSLTSPLRAAAWLWLIGALASAIARAAEPSEHGIWLVAYLFLVGFVAQLLLGRGQDAISPAAPARLVSLQAALWNLGVVAVPAGVLADIRLPVAVGSLALVAALLLFWRSVHPAYAVRGAARTAIGRAYVGLLAFMLASTLTGMALASDVPWAG